jgi:hypothetical protein
VEAAVIRLPPAGEPQGNKENKSLSMEVSVSSMQLLPHDESVCQRDNGTMEPNPMYIPGCKLFRAFDQLTNLSSDQLDLTIHHHTDLVGILPQRVLLPVRWFLRQTR